MSLKARMARPISSSPRASTRVPRSPRGKLRKPRGELLYGAADAMGQVDQQHQRNDPDQRGQQHISVSEPAQQVARLRASPRSPAHCDIRAKVHPGPPRPSQWTTATPRRPGAPGIRCGRHRAPEMRKRSGIAALEKALHRRGPLGLAGARRSVALRLQAAGQRVVLQRIAGALVQLFAGLLQGAREPVQLSGRGIAQTAIQQRSGDPEGGGQGARVAARKIPISLLRSRFTTLARRGPPTS